MTESATLTQPVRPNTEQFDAVIVGAGISRIGGAYHVQQPCPNKSFVVLETRASFGGTWMTHTFPGIPEWQHTQDYWSEQDVFPAVDLDDGLFVYE